MKTELDDASLSMNEFYDSIIVDYESMSWFLEKYDDIDKVNLYRYVLEKAKALSEQDKEANSEMISYCWLASVELEQTEAIQRYLRGEITQEDIAKHEAQKEQEIQEIVERLEQRRKEKNSMFKQFTNMFRRTR